MKFRATLIVGALLPVAAGIVVLTTTSHRTVAGNAILADSGSASMLDATRSADPPPMPASFYGTVTVNGADAPEGTQVSAWIDEVMYAKTGAFTFDGRSMYAMDVPGDDPSTPEVDWGWPGDTIVFHVGGLVAVGRPTARYWEARIRTWIDWVKASCPAG